MQVAGGNLKKIELNSCSQEGDKFIWENKNYAKKI